MILVRDILALSEENPRRMRLEGLRGTPYSLLHAVGHLFLLTTGLVIFPDLASRFLAGEALDQSVDAYHSPVQAVEAFIAGERSLMVVTDEGFACPRFSPSASREMAASLHDRHPRSPTGLTPRRRSSASYGMGGAGCVTAGFGKQFGLAYFPTIAIGDRTTPRSHIEFVAASSAGGGWIQAKVECQSKRRPFRLPSKSPILVSR